MVELEGPDTPGVPYSADSLLRRGAQCRARLLPRTTHPTRRRRPTLLPHRSDAGYGAASAAALLHGARVGETASAEEATGLRWGDAALIPHVERILADARTRKDERLEQVAERFLKAAGAPG